MIMMVMEMILARIMMITLVMTVVLSFRQYQAFPFILIFQAVYLFRRFSPKRELPGWKVQGT